MDKEFEALKQIDAKLAEFPLPAQERIINWLISYLRERFAEAARSQAS